MSETEYSGKVLYRVVSLRDVDGKPLTHVRWMSDRGTAVKYIDWINDGRGKVIDFAEYVRKERDK